MREGGEGVEQKILMFVWRIFVFECKICDVRCACGCNLFHTYMYVYPLREGHTSAIAWW
jgi:hypothetical protein